MGNFQCRVSRMRCSAKRCTADPGSQQSLRSLRSASATIPVLRRTTPLRSVLRRARETYYSAAAFAPRFFSIWPIASTTASKVSSVEAWRAL
jgi:hypothetical protein